MFYCLSKRQSNLVVYFVLPLSDSSKLMSFIPIYPNKVFLGPVNFMDNNIHEINEYNHS